MVQYGETSIVAITTTPLDDQKDRKLAKLICDRFKRGGAGMTRNRARPATVRQTVRLSPRIILAG